MSEALLHADIVSFMRSHQGKDKAIPRRELLAHLHRLGHTLTDRTLRRAYAAMPQIGYCVDGEKRGLFWITNAADRAVAQETLHGRAMAELVREKAIREKSLPVGQMELFT